MPLHGKCYSSTKSAYGANDGGLAFGTDDWSGVLSLGTMRILLVTQYFPPEPMRAGDLALGLRELGHDVTVLTGFPSYPYDRLYEGYRLRLVQREAYQGVHVIRVPSIGKYGPGRLKRVATYLSFACSASVLGPLLVGRPDWIVVFQNSPATMAIPAVVIKALRGSRLILWVQDLWPETLQALGVITYRGLLRLVDAMVRVIYRRSDVILVQSCGFVDSIITRGVPTARITYLPNWAEDIYQVLPFDEGFSRAEDLTAGFKVMFAGNIGIAQNLSLLLDVAETLHGHSEIRFIVIGDGSEFRSLNESARRRGLQNVVFKGRQPIEKMPKYFAAADALLVQLKMNPVFEVTIPSKLQSYMACGRPILAALSGSGAEVVSEAGAGIVCRPDDPQALRDAVLALWRMPREERELMGIRARRYYEQHFDRRLVLARIHQILMDSRVS